MCSARTRGRLPLKERFGSADGGHVEVAAWLAGLGLGQYTRAFAENGVDAEVLPRLTSEDLKEMGVVAVGHRRKLVNAVAALHDRGASANGAARGREAPAGEP